MKIKHAIYGTVFGLLLGGSVSAATITGPEAEDLLVDNGFTDISVLDYRDGMWVGTARNRDGELVAVRIDANKKVTWGNRTTTTTTTTTRTAPVRVARADPPVVVEEVVVETPVVRRPVMVEQRVLVPVGGRISKNDVRLVLAANGYHNIHDIDWLSSRGVWKAEARDPTGDDREIHLDPYDGTIVHEEDD